ncbi:thioredoxin-related transmembrane protein 1-like isoform X2 [Ptychodera flava]|uniref:thioredoxin-related transmembrane protein 1-like isoform X2 n=1 Tax=Ptychodera flava TaxID=63121 RepID=UPI00396A50F9
MAAAMVKGMWCSVCILLVVPLLQIDAANKRDPIVITEDNWRQMLEGEWMVKFYAPWCPACKGVEPAWKSFSEWGEDLDISVADVDVTQEPGLSGRFMVTSLPTIYHVINGEFRRYMGPRGKDDFITFIEERRYVDIEPMSSWKSPNSISMSLLSWLFKISMVVRNIHTSLTEDYNVPVYGSYALFAVATILMGLLLGVALVFLTDCLCPTRPHSNRQRPTEQIKTDKAPSEGEKQKENSGNEEGSENTGDIDSSDTMLRQRKPATASETENKKKDDDDDDEDDGEKEEKKEDAEESKSSDADDKKEN